MKNAINGLQAALLVAALYLGVQFSTQLAYAQSTEGWTTYNGVNFSFNYPPDWKITQDTPTEVDLAKADMNFTVLYATNFGTNVNATISALVTALQNAGSSKGYIVS